MDQASDKDILCSVCHSSIRGTDFVACALCEIPVHRACWAYASHCPAYGCESSTFAEPADLIFRKTTAAIVVDGSSEAPVSAADGELERRSIRYLALDANRQRLYGALHQLRGEREVRRSRVFWMSVGGALLTLWLLAGTGIDMVFDPAFLVGFFAFAGAASHAWARDAVSAIDGQIFKVENEVRQLERTQDSIRLVPDGQAPVRELPRRLY